MGWNIIDFAQFWIFLVFYYFSFLTDHPRQDEFMPTINFLIVMLSFIKFLFFVRIFQEYGFLV